MPWVRIDDTLHDHPKVYRLPATIRLHCIGAWTLAICYASRHLTDGEVPVDWLRAKGAQPRHVVALIEADFFETGETNRTVWVHDFLDYNPSREQIERRREEGRDAKVAAGRIGGKRSAEERARRKQKASTDPSTDPSNGQADMLDDWFGPATGRLKQKASPVPSRPVPSPSRGSTTTSEAVGPLAAAVDPVETAG